MNAYIDEVCSINKISQNEIHAGPVSYTHLDVYKRQNVHSFNLHN